MSGISQLSYLPTTFGWPAVVTNDGIGTDLSNLAAVTEKSTLVRGTRTRFLLLIIFSKNRSRSCLSCATSRSSTTHSVCLRRRHHNCTVAR